MLQSQPPSFYSAFVGHIPVFRLRSVSAEFDGSMDLKGITVHRYMLPPQTFASPVDNPDNWCYCTNKETTRNCTLAGVLDVTACRGVCFTTKKSGKLHQTLSVTRYS